MKDFQINIVLNAQNNLDKLSDWQKGFINELMKKPVDESLNLAETAQLNAIAEKLA